MPDNELYKREKEAKAILAQLCLDKYFGKHIPIKIINEMSKLFDSYSPRGDIGLFQYIYDMHTIACSRVKNSTESVHSQPLPEPSDHSH